MKFRNLRLEIDSGGVAELTLERPAVLNALNEETIRELDSAFRSLERNEEVRVVLLSGAGKAFSAGADIPEVHRLDAETSQAFSRRGHAALNRIERGSKPVLAAVRGFCLGGGCELALACHIRIAGTDARIGLPEVKLGIIPGYGGTQRLARIVGRSKGSRVVALRQDHVGPGGLGGRPGEPRRKTGGSSAHLSRTGFPNRRSGPFGRQVLFRGGESGLRPAPASRTRPGDGALRAGFGHG